LTKHQYKEYVYYNDMANKDQLIKEIQDWVRLDNEIRKLKKEERTRQVERAKISENLLELMRTSDIDQVDINNGKLIYSKRNVKKPITKKSLLTILAKFYEGDVGKAVEINKFISDNREETTIESIVRRVKNKDEV
jgi:hypothetical protein